MGDLGPMLVRCWAVYVEKHLQRQLFTIFSAPQSNNYKEPPPSYVEVMQVIN